MVLFVVPINDWLARIEFSQPPLFSPACYLIPKADSSINILALVKPFTLSVFSSKYLKVIIPIYSRYTLFNLWWRLFSKGMDRDRIGMLSCYFGFILFLLDLCITGKEIVYSTRNRLFERKFNFLCRLDPRTSKYLTIFLNYCAKFNSF